MRAVLFNMEKNIFSQDALMQDMEKQKELLAGQQGLWEHRRTAMALERIVQDVGNLSVQILQSMGQQKGWRRSVVNLVAAEVVRAGGGELSVPNYQPRARSEQQVYLFDRTHWKQLDQQVFFDFVKDAAAQAGMLEAEREDPALMESLAQQIAFRVARSQHPYVPEQEAWINMQNGTLVIHPDGTIELRQHRREDCFRYVLPYVYDPHAQCPQWHRFLDQMLPEQDAQQILAEYVGYCLTGHVKAEKMLVLYGRGSNGKSVVLDTIEALMGSENVSNVSLADLTCDDEKRSMIEGKLLNISFESDRELDNSMLKLLVSGEPVAVRRLYVGSHVMRQYAKLITSFNVLPRAENTYGYLRRFIILPFKTTIKAEDADLQLAGKLKQELPGILNWTLEALTGFLQRQAFSESEVCRRELERYKHTANSVLLFLEDMCQADDTFTTNGKDLFASYKQYCYNDLLRPLGKLRFFEMLEAQGIRRTEFRRNIMFNIRMIGNNE